MLMANRGNENGIRNFELDLTSTPWAKKMINFHPFQIACLFDSFCHWFSIKFLKLYLVSCQFSCRVFKLILVKLLIVCVFTIISQGAPLGLAVEMN